MRITRLLGPVLVAILILGLVGETAQAQSNRSEKKLGVHVGLIGDPFPTLIGGNVNYNVMDWARASVGYGSFSVSATGGDLTASTFGLGARFMVPDWNLTPVVGISWATVSVSASVAGVSGDIGGFSGSASHMYATFGFDWQTGGGFNVGAGYNLSLKSGVGGLPYVNLGWYFAL